MSPPRPSILLATTTPLLPTNSGGRLYAWGTTAPLAEHFDYHLLAMATEEERDEFAASADTLAAQYHRVFRSFRFVDRPPIPADMGRSQVLRHLLFHTRHRLPLMDVSYCSPAAVQVAREIVAREAVDLIEVDHLQMAFVRTFLPDTPAVLVNHNIEGEVHPFWMTRRWSLPELAVWRLFAGVSRHNTRRIELGNALGFSAKFFISERDRAIGGAGCPSYLLPVPMAPQQEEKRFNTDRFVALWIGGFDWPPNAEAARWLVTEIWPRFTAKWQSQPVELHLVGRDPPAELEARDERDGLFVHGHVDDIEPLKAGADALVAPLRSGSGVRVKIVEALAAGIPVVATSKGGEGLPPAAGKHILVADNTDGYVDALARLADSLPLRRSLSDGGKEYVAEHHDPERVAALKAAALEDVLAAAASTNQD